MKTSVSYSSLADQAALPHTQVRQLKSHRWIWAVLFVLCGIGAAAVLIRITALSSPSQASASVRTALNMHFSAKAGLVLLHIVPSLLFVMLVPLQFVKSLRQHRPRLHRWSGRVLMCLGLVLGASALMLSLHPIGGEVESAATILFGCFFLLSLGMAWWHIRHQRIELHREWVIRMTAIALGVATTRPIIGVFFATSMLTGLTPQQFFGPAMWIGFTATYIGSEAWIRFTRSHSMQENNKAAPSLSSQEVSREFLRT